MNRNARRLANGHQTGDDGVWIAALLSQHFAMIIGRDAAHVVVDRREHRDWLTAKVNTGKHFGAFRDARQTLGQDLRIQMIEMQIDMVVLRTDAPAFANLNGHRARDDIARGQILGVRGIPLHEALAL